MRAGHWRSFIPTAMDMPDIAVEIVTLLEVRQFVSEPAPRDRPGGRRNGFPPARRHCGEPELGQPYPRRRAGPARAGGAPAVARLPGHAAAGLPGAGGLARRGPGLGQGRIAQAGPAVVQDAGRLLRRLPRAVPAAGPRTAVAGYRRADGRARAARP